MSDFSDAGSASSDVGSEAVEVESTDSDYGDGDGVNDFDETYNEMQDDSSDFEYDDGSDSDASQSDLGSEDEPELSSEEKADGIDAEIEDDVPEETEPVDDYTGTETDVEISSEERANEYNDAFEDDLIDDTEPVDDADQTDAAEPIDETEAADDTEQVDEAEAADATEQVDDAEVADAAEQVDDAEAADAAEQVDDAEVADAAEQVDDAEAADAADQAENTDDVDANENPDTPVDEASDETGNDEANEEDLRDAEVDEEPDTNQEDIDDLDEQDDVDEGNEANASEAAGEDNDVDADEASSEVNDDTDAGEDSDADASDETGEAYTETGAEENTDVDESDDSGEVNTEAGPDENTDDVDVNENPDTPVDEAADETGNDEANDEDLRDAEVDEEPDTDEADVDDIDEQADVDEENEADGSAESGDANAEAGTEENTDVDESAESGEVNGEADADKDNDVNSSDESGETNAEAGTEEKTDVDGSDESGEDNGEAGADDNNELKDDETSGVETSEDVAESEPNNESEREIETDSDNAEPDSESTDTNVDETRRPETQNPYSEPDNVSAGIDNTGDTNDGSTGEFSDGSQEHVDSTPDEGTTNPETEKQEKLENVSYHQGQNDIGALGTCGPTSIANSLNRVTGTNKYTENAVLHSAMDNNLCHKSDNPYACGGTTTNDVVNIIDKVKDPESNIHTEVYDYDKAMDVDSLADRLDESGTVAMVGVDSATLWDQRGDVSNSGLFQGASESPSDHWITVDSPVRDENGNLTGFNIVDSGGGVGYVDGEKFERMYMGDDNHKVSDPTAIIISNKGAAVNTFSQPEGVERAANYKGSSSELPSDRGDPPQEYDGVNPETAYKVRDITAAYYEQAGDLARSDKVGRVFTDHKEDHVEMVADKSIEAGDAIKTAVENGGLRRINEEGRVAFSSDIDKMSLEGAALSHDTGMAGNGYELTPILDEKGIQAKDEHGQKLFEKNPDGSYVVQPESNKDFNVVRDNHSLNSAINVLANRDQYKAAGYSDVQVDKMAAECMAHSKSSSGVSDLNSKANWSDCFDRIDSTVTAYNSDHPDAPISFDRSSFEGDDKQLESLATETFALRIGDVSRNSGPEAEAHSGEAVYVDRSTINDHAGSVEGELKNANITIGENGDPIENIKSRQVHVGEQNIIDNHTYVGDNGNLAHEVTVADGSSAPKCTQEALNDHLGELASAKDGEFDVDISFDRPCDEYAKESYEKFRDEAAGKYDNVNIHYPWDKEEII